MTADLKKAWDAFQYGPHPDVDDAPMEALCKAIEQHVERDKLVQEVIAKYKAMADAVLRQGDCDDGPLFDALAKLAEFSP